MQLNLKYSPISVLKKAFDAFDQEKQGYIDAAMVRFPHNNPASQVANSQEFLQ